MKDKFFIIDLFSGSGGSALGFKKAGFLIKAAVEINIIASETFKANFPESVMFPVDIREVSGKDILKKCRIKDKNRVVILACPPCQGFSSARRVQQRGSDPRNLLIFEFVRMVKEIKPIAFVMENVPGLARGIGKTIFLQTLNKLKDLGYSITEPKILEAADYGVPQKRKRLVIMGTRKNKIILNLPEPTNRNPGLSSGFLPVWKTVKQQIGELLSIKAGEKNITDPMHVSANLSERNLKRLQNTPHDGGDRTSWSEDLVLECHKNVSGYKDVYGRMKWNFPSPTITGGCAMISKGRFGHPEQNRAISLREAARLQTFPDNFIFKGNFGQIAGQIGNAVPSLLAQRIAESLLKAFFILNKHNRKLKKPDVKSLQYGFASVNHSNYS